MDRAFHRSERAAEDTATSSNSNDLGDSDIANDSSGLQETRNSGLSRAVSTDNTAVPAKKRAK